MPTGVAARYVVTTRMTMYLGPNYEHARHRACFLVFEVLFATTPSNFWHFYLGATLSRDRLSVLRKTEPKNQGAPPLW